MMIKKAVIILLLSLIVLGCAACGVKYTPERMDQEIEEIAAEITDFDLPEGYAPEFGVKLLGYSVAAFDPGDGHSHIYLIQSEKDSDFDTFSEVLEQVVPGYKDVSTRMTILSEQVISVRGAEGLLVLSEGTNAEQMMYRQITLNFQGKGGPAMLLFSEPESRWEQGVVDHFLKSLR